MQGLIIVYCLIYELELLPFKKIVVAMKLLKHKNYSYSYRAK